jgi:signal transduction histidine kinase
VSHAFFGRLAAHLNSLRGRAAAIVQGYRGAPLGSRRRDELGELSRAIDGMAAELAERERRLELGLRQQIHVERMAAVGAMAAHAAHEIGNPLAVISGYAEELGAPAIVEQAQRIAAATRRMAELAQQPGEARAVPVDLAAAVRAVCELLRFDPRLRAGGIAADIAPGLPAAQAVPGALSHVLLNLALAGAARPGAPPAGPVRVRAGREGARLYVRVEPAFADAGRMLVAEHLAAGLGAELELDPAAPGATLWLRSAAGAEAG